MALNWEPCKMPANLAGAWKPHILQDFSVSTEISTGRRGRSRQPRTRCRTRTYPKRGRFLAFLTRKLPRGPGMVEFKSPADHGEPALAGKTGQRAEQRHRLRRCRRCGTAG